MTLARKNRQAVSPQILVALALVTIGLGACAARFNQVALNNATSLKERTLATLDKANTPYADHQAEVETLQSELDKAWEYAKGLPKNDASAQQWALLRNPDGHLAGGALKKWRAEGKLSPAMVTEISGQIAHGFDEIIELENKKPKD
jgi:hypothetical protein